MSQIELLLKKVEGLPPDYMAQIFDFIDHLKHKVSPVEKASCPERYKAVEELEGLGRQADSAASVSIKTDPERYPWEAAIGKYKDCKFSTEELLKERARDLLREEAKIFRKITPETLEIAAKRGVSPAELGLGEFV
jgi:hypothetical protein